MSKNKPIIKSCFGRFHRGEKITLRGENFGLNCKLFYYKPEAMVFLTDEPRPDMTMPGIIVMQKIIKQAENEIIFMADTNGFIRSAAKYVAIYVFVFSGPFIHNTTGFPVAI